MAFSWRETHDKSDTESDSSGPASSLLLYTLLPSLVQRRIPKLRSLKQALTDYEARTRHSRILSQASVESITPPPSYQSNVDDSEQTDGQPSAFRSGHSSSASSRPSSSGSTTPAYLEEVRSGVNWRYAEPGFSLLSLSSQEASTICRSPHLVRRQYIDGVACVLRGLPLDLTTEEELCLREALPTSLIPPDAADDQVMLRPGSGGDLQTTPTSAAHQSTLHRCVAAATLYIFLAISFLTPYIQLLLRQAYQFDRRHKISDRVLAQSVIAADAMGRQTIMIAQHVCSLNEGMVGEAMKGMGVYCVQGFSGGVYDGLGEGMQAIGLRNGGRGGGAAASSRRPPLDSENSRQQR